MRGDELAPTPPAVVPVTGAASGRAHARAVVDAHWGDRGHPARERDVIDLLLVVSELVTNAVVHAGTPSVLRMLLPGRHTQGAVRVEVADLSTCPPRQRHADGEDTNGRGLELVSGLADRWGWQHEGFGKRIWCELDRSGGAQGSLVSVSGLPAEQLTADLVSSADGGLPA